MPAIQSTPRNELYSRRWKNRGKGHNNNWKLLLGKLNNYLLNSRSMEIHSASDYSHCQRRRMRWWVELKPQTTAAASVVKVAIFGLTCLVPSIFPDIHEVTHCMPSSSLVSASASGNNLINCLSVPIPVQLLFSSDGYEIITFSPSLFVHTRDAGMAWTDSGSDKWGNERLIGDCQQGRRRLRTYYEPS